jgi:hypothetical protein
MVAVQDYDKRTREIANKCNRRNHGWGTDRGHYRESDANPIRDVDAIQNREN